MSALQPPVFQETSAVSPMTAPNTSARPSSEQGTRATPGTHVQPTDQLDLRPSTAAMPSGSHPTPAARALSVRPMTAASIATTREGSEFGGASRPASTASKGGLFGFG
eukprot:CAMPEP_0173429114 /NCGR_PEP_ID=MMETSP1357-20121228/7914_1 /TAXON_ID=77926 /ORGANISM="Hemiselmis rufescens, Strain PCC563" /LENGTH=107 /DNA_ID=CAMNT_0014393245 /DNA_START=130 /DNA_END=450 /DNA_ORIENTATION=+